MKKRIIFDADLTMGVPDCDVDDGLALLYALGKQAEVPQSVEILGITTSYGNNTLPVVHENAQRVVAELGLSLPVLEGAHDKDTPESDAAHFLVEQANAYPGEISLSVTGSTTNLKGAVELDKDVLSKFKEIVCMGGITQTLVFNGVIMDELNFSCDPEATLLCLTAAQSGARIVVMTANNCLPAYFSLSDFRTRFGLEEHPDNYFGRVCLPWFDTMQRWYGLDGFVCWDVLTSAYILDPHLFADESLDVVLDKKLLGAGYLEPGFAGAPQARIIAPTIKDSVEFCERCYEMWEQAHSPCL